MREQDEKIRQQHFSSYEKKKRSKIIAHSIWFRKWKVKHWSACLTSIQTTHQNILPANLIEKRCGLFKFLRQLSPIVCYHIKYHVIISGHRHLRCFRYLNTDSFSIAHHIPIHSGFNCHSKLHRMPLGVCVSVFRTNWQGIFNMVHMHCTSTSYLFFIFIYCLHCAALFAFQEEARVGIPLHIKYDFVAASITSYYSWFLICAAHTNTHTHSSTKNKRTRNAILHFESNMNSIKFEVSNIHYTTHMAQHIAFCVCVAGHLQP